MKSFDSWNSEKKKIEDTGHRNLIFHEREIWWCSLGLNIGSEEDGKNNMFERPVLVVKKFNNNICWVLPMTSKVSKNQYYLQISGDDSHSVVISQLRLVSVKRFRRLIRKISQKQYKLIIFKIIQILKTKTR